MRRRLPAPGGRRCGNRAAPHGPQDVCGEEPPSPFCRASDEKRAPPCAPRAGAGARPAPAERRPTRDRARTGDPSRRRAARRGGSRCGATRHRQDRRARRDPAQARAAGLRRMADHAQSPGGRRADPLLGPRHDASRKAGPIDARTLGRRRVSGRAHRRADPARSAPDRGLRRIRRDDGVSAVAEDTRVRGGGVGAATLRRHAVRSRAGGVVLRLRLPGPTGRRGRE